MSIAAMHATSLGNNEGSSSRIKNLGGASTGKNREVLTLGGSVWTPASLDTNVAGLGELATENDAASRVTRQ
jgi:hypothetical protein